METRRQASMHGKHCGRTRRTYKAKPVRSNIAAMSGKEISNRFLLPNVSIVQTAGAAKTKLTAPKPKDARSAAVWLNPPMTKMFEL